ncbi:Anthranilate phosphoribosyltransferase [Candidatus Lokiarchaeum ossiferum]|uniref:Anthranilate phosphoribosyltransferase n=1 Tax=Candidatus Lokiarchaeum ossiferum TaxID=2951803 RepID=A0ABY6HX58_9ARCH|nr:Anthranilate phosphoribosyltransferase [Candidatus Lokiarchaeum sp. B-35]
MSSIQSGIINLVEGNELSRYDTQQIIREIMQGHTSDSEIASFLTALCIRGETSEIIAGAAEIMREYASQITPNTTEPLVDTCGTGGDNANTFNISTLAAIVAAGAGVHIAKHGNRSISSKCGSADLLEAFGVKINLEPEEVKSIIEKIGIGFMFAPKFHPAMKYVMPVRRSLKMRTVFNILGPLTNPANAKSHVLGVFNKELIQPLAEVMNKLGANHVYIINSEPGIDEIIPYSEVHVGEVKEGEIEYYSLKPSDFGVNSFYMSELSGGTIEKNLEIAVKILKNEDLGIKREIVLINAAFAVLSAYGDMTYDTAYEKVKEALTTGKALKKLEELVRETQGSILKFNEVIQ